MDKRGKISALIERLRVYRFEIDGEEINAGDVMQKLVDAASEPIDQHMLNDLFDCIEKVEAGEHGMDGAVREIARKAAAIRGPMFRSVRTAPSAKRREARRAAVTLLEIIDDGEVWRVALNAMFRVLNASDDAEHWTTVSEARSALKAALRAIAEDG